MRGLQSAVLALVLVVALGALAAGPGNHAVGAPPPGSNVILLLTDDQPNSNMGPMPATRSLIGGAGATFRQAYVSYPLCCPSRASILTGLYMHNHGVRGNSGTYGGWHRFHDQAVDEPNALPARLEGAGYYDTHVGKYFNGYTAAEGLFVPPGWDEWYGRIGGERKVYYDYTLVEQGPSGIPASVYYGFNEADYSTDVFASKALDFIERADTLGQPFFLDVSFSAPHHPFTPAPTDLYTRDGEAIPPRPGFNEKNIKDKPRWLRREARHRLGPAERMRIADQQRRRDETLEGVDRAVASIISALEQQGLLDDTYIIFTSDNGLLRGEHRIAGGKYLPYEPSSHVPLMIRGPGITPGTTVDELVANVDLAPTMLDIAGIPDLGLDGRSLLPFLDDPTLRTTRPLLMEADTGPGRGIGAGNDPDLAVGSAVRKAGLARLKGVRTLDAERLAGVSQATGDRAPAYRAIRTDRYLFVLYSTGDRELYDMQADPSQLRSVAYSKRYEPVRKWLFSHLVELIDCDGQACRDEIGQPPSPLPAGARRR